MDEMAREIHEILIHRYARRMPHGMLVDSTIREIAPPDDIDRIVLRVIEEMPLQPFDSNRPASLPAYVDLRRELVMVGDMSLFIWHGAGKKTIFFARREVE